MALSHQVKRELVSLPSFVTYGATPTYSVATTVQSVRDRNWTRAFKNSKEMLSALIKQGFLPTQPYTDTLQDVIRSKMVTFTGQLFRSQTNSTFAMSIIPGTPRQAVDPLTDPGIAQLYSTVLGQLQTRISGHGTNLIVSAHEAKSTVGMIGDAAQKLGLAYADVKKGKFLQAARRLGLASVPKGVRANRSAMNNWLEYRYGWRLVCLDIQSLMKTLYDSLTARPPLLRVTGFAASQSTTTSIAPGQSISTPNGYGLFTYTRTRKTEYAREVRGGYVYELQCVPLATGQSFGLLNLFTVIWESIPYSFVLDWLLNVGSVLEGITAFQGKTCKDGWINRSIESRMTETWSDMVAIPQPSGVAFYRSDTYNYVFGPAVERRFNRQPMGFTPTSLRIDLDLNVSRAVDAIALVKQRFC